MLLAAKREPTAPVPYWSAEGVDAAKVRDTTKSMPNTRHAEEAIVREEVIDDAPELKAGATRAPPRAGGATRVPLPKEFAGAAKRTHPPDAQTVREKAASLPSEDVGHPRPAKP